MGFIIESGVLTGFVEESGVTEITIPDSVVTIGARAFWGCSSLTSISIPDSVTSIGDWAFWGCSSLTSISIPDSVTFIGDWAFRDCGSLKSISIPDSMVTIGAEAFKGCQSLADENGYVVVAGVLYWYCGKTTSISIPAGVTTIGAGAFACCENLTSISIPAGVTTIGARAFNYCESLKSITIPDSVTSIRERAFYGCKSLTSITLPDSVTSIGDWAFYDCRSLTEITIPDSVTTIGDWAFYGCKSPTSITLPDSVTSIGDGVFRGCGSLKSISIPDSVTSIGDGAFRGCGSLKSISIPDSVTSIGECAFVWCSSLTDVTLSANLTELGASAFEECHKLQRFGPINPKMHMGGQVFGNDMPAGLHHQALELEGILSDADLKRYLLNKRSWSQLSPTDKVTIFLNRQGKTAYSGYLDCMTGEDAELIADAVLEKLNGKARARECTTAANLMITFQGLLSDQKLNALKKALESLMAGAKALQKVKADPNLMLRFANKEELTLPEAERYIVELLAAEQKTIANVLTDLKSSYSLTKDDLPELRYADGRTAAPYVLAWLLTAHEGMTRNNWVGEELSVLYPKPGLRPEAVRVLAQIDGTSLQSCLTALAKQNLGLSGRSKKMYLAYPICRYADDALMESLLKIAPKWRSSVSGNDAPPLRTFRDASLYSENKAVILFAEKYGDLDKYARIRGTDADTIRDTVLADVGLDDNGTKRYELGSTTILLTLQKDLTVTLFDEKANKAVKSIPKRGNDEALAAAAAADLALLKKNVKKIVKTRADNLLGDFLTGKQRGSTDWLDAYSVNPLLRTVAELVVWQQGEATFTLRGKTAVLADGVEYTVTDQPIGVAHPMEMKPEDVSAWQKYFTVNQLKQPFLQLWEPVVSLSAVKEDRYAGCMIPYYRFLHREKHGIYVTDRNFHNEIDIEFADCDAHAERIDWIRHGINPDDRFEVTSFVPKAASRQANHIAAYLDRITVYERAAKDDLTVVNQLDSFNLTQLMELIQFVEGKNAANVLALLLEYKNVKYPDADPFMDFVLDL